MVVQFRALFKGVRYQSPFVALSKVVATEIKAKEGIHSLICPATGYKVSLLFFYKDNFGIK